MNTGGKATGIAAEARISWRTRLSAPGLPEFAIAPMFQIIGRPASRLVVPMNSIRPLRCSTAILASSSSFTYWSITRASRAVEDSAVPLSRPDRTVVSISMSVSYFE
jgi:hypothetical protein